MRDIAESIMIGLMRRGAPEHIAKGIVANMIVESRLDPGINEINPVVEGSRGGFGLNQWTGPRRRAFEAFARQRGVDPSDLGAQLDFTMQELRTTERPAWNALQGADNPQEAARIYSEEFLRPGIPHMDRRIAAANSLAGYDVGGGGDQNSMTGAQTPTQPQRNALRLQDTRLDPQMFMSKRRFG